MKTDKLLSRVVFIGMFSVTAVISTVLNSCSTSHSVREIRASRDPNAEYIPRSVKIKVPQTKDDALIKELFMQTSRPNIELPYQDGENKGVAVASEQVTFINPESIGGNRTTLDNKNPNLNEIQHLSEVVVTAKSRFTPEQNGRVNVDFVVRVPKEMLSEDFRVTLSPQILHNDSVVPLNDVVVKGQEFYDKQKQDHQDYDDFLKSIVSPHQYDSVFVDYDGVKEDIDFYQELFYKQYHKEWSRQTDYEQWKAKKEDAEALSSARKAGMDKMKYHEHVRKARQQAMKEAAKGKDTTGYFAKYMKNVINPHEIEKNKIKIEQRNDYRLDFFEEYSKRAKENTLRDWAMGKDTVGSYQKYMRTFDKNLKTLMLDGEDLKKIPERFRDLYRSGRKMDAIESKAFTKEDSIEIAKHRYMFEEIALNEMKDERREEKKKEMIPFPYELNTRLDSVIQTDHDFVYYYKQDYPVSPGLKQLRLVMDTRIDAVDRSTFIPPTSDTLAYFISSLSQLADTSLIVKRTTLHRDVYSSMTIYPKFQPGKAIFAINYKDNKLQADTLLNTYRTFTNNGGLAMDSMVVRVTTSLDGSYEKNEELSKKRAEALQDYFAKTLGISPDLFKIRVSGEDWNTLAKLIVRRNDMPNKSDVLAILTSAVYPDQTEGDIKKAFPQDFKVIKDSIYPMLNKAEITFNMTRPGMTEEVSVNTEERPEYAQALQYLLDREYWKALDILSNYPDFNTALCLVCMGYNNKALEVLDMIGNTGNTEYLRAILAIRAGNDNRAISHLLNACEMDPSKAYRAPLDPEVAGLVRMYNLQGQLNEKAAASGQMMDTEEEVK